MGKDDGGSGCDDLCKPKTRTVYVVKDPEFKEAIENFLEAWDSQTEDDKPYKPKISMGAKAAINKLRRVVE